MSFVEGSKDQENPRSFFGKSKKEGNIFLCEIHPINSSPYLSVVVVAESGDEALLKCKRKYGNEYVGTYRLLDGIIM